MSLILKDIKVSYEGMKFPILEFDNLILNEGLNFLIGKNGSGKSTLLKALSNYSNQVSVEGLIELDGEKLINGYVGLVSQDPEKSINLELSFLENLILAKTNGWNHLSFLTQISRVEENHVIQFLKGFNNWELIEALLNVEANNLSSGQKQILAIFMRVIRYRKVLLLDECTANLDYINTGIIIDILSEMGRNGTIIVFATHQRELLETDASNIYLVENGNITRKV